MKMHNLSIILKVIFSRELLVDHMVTTKLNPHVLMVNIAIVSPIFFRFETTDPNAINEGDKRQVPSHGPVETWLLLIWRS